MVCAVSITVKVCVFDSLFFFVLFYFMTRIQYLATAVSSSSVCVLFLAWMPYISTQMLKMGNRDGV